MFSKTAIYSTLVIATSGIHISELAWPQAVFLHYSSQILSNSVQAWPFDLWWPIKVVDLHNSDFKRKRTSNRTFWGINCNSSSKTHEVIQFSICPTPSFCHNCDAGKGLIPAICPGCDSPAPQFWMPHGTPFSEIPIKHPVTLSN